MHTIPPYFIGKVFVTSMVTYRKVLLRCTLNKLTTKYWLIGMVQEGHF